MSNLLDVWSQVTSLLKDGVSLIPVRDKQEGDFVAKSPYGKWREYQRRIVTEGELWEMMERFDTTAIAMVCGAISGNMEAIDIDVKYKPGIDAILFNDLRQFYPDLFSRLRVHKTPSGGYHIPYRVEGGHQVPGNIKLAGRYASDDELELQRRDGRKRLTKEMNFIETRGEGGYILAPPSMGYSIHIDNPVPTITWEERCSIIRLCESYTEIVKMAPAPKPTKSQSDYYTTNPFEDFNNRVDPTQLITQFGWKFSHENAQYIYYTRPDKQRGVSASWNKSKRVFYIFTASTELVPSRGYLPATIVAELQFGGDKSKTYYHLTKEGYGVIKPKVEAAIVKKQAVNGKGLPDNVSDEAKQQYEQIQNDLNENLPFGHFWELGDDSVTISREDLYRVAREMGFGLYNGELIRIEGNIITPSKRDDFYNALKNYIFEEEFDIYVDICNAFEAFLQKSGEFTISRLDQVPPERIMRDGRHHAYKYFANGFKRISADGVTFHDYGEATGLIWGNKISPHQHEPDAPSSTIFRDYLTNATRLTDYVKRCIGYLAHDFKSESSGYILVLTEMVPDPKEGGGSGKNIFGNMFAHTTTVKTVPGSAVKFDDKFFASWNGERIYFLADIPKRIDWPFLKEMATGTGYVNKKYKAEYSVDSADMPKLLLNTNDSYDDTDGGLRRRIKQVEFTDFYTRNGGVDTVHGKMFPEDFTEEDWAGYYEVIDECLIALFKAGGKIESIALSDEGWQKKFNMNYGELTYTFINDNIENWFQAGFVSNKNFNEQYQNFCSENDIQPKYRLSAKSMVAGLKEYCARNGVEFDGSSVSKVNSVSTRGKRFGGNESPESSDLPF